MTGLAEVLPLIIRQVLEWSGPWRSAFWRSWTTALGRSRPDGSVLRSWPSHDQTALPWMALVAELYA